MRKRKDEHVDAWKDFQIDAPRPRDAVTLKQLYSASTKYGVVGWYCMFSVGRGQPLRPLVKTKGWQTPTPSNYDGIWWPAAAPRLLYLYTRHVSP